MKRSLLVQSPEQAPEDLDERDACLLEQAVEKLVRYGQKVGVSPEEMISLLWRWHGLRYLLGRATTGSAGGTPEMEKASLPETLKLLAGAIVWRRNPFLSSKSPR